MNQTTPKSSGINYAKLRKQKYKEQTIPKSMSNNLKFDIHTNHGILKQRSTSQHNINEYTQQIQLFEQYFNQSKTHIQFIDFVTKQLQYHTSPIQVNANIFKNCQKKWEDEKRKILCDLNQFKEENCLLQSEIHELKRQKIALSKQCENLQTAIVQEKLGKLHRHPVYHHKFQELTKNIHIPTQETISSLTDERFESHETSLDSSLSNDEDQQLYPQFFGKHRYQFSKKLN